MKSTEPDLKSQSRVKSMHLHRLTLRFSGPMAGLEAPYREHYLVQTLFQIRISFILGALMYAIFGILDILVLPDYWHITWLIRYAIVCPCILAVVGATFLPRFHRYLQPMMSVAGYPVHGLQRNRFKTDNQALPDQQVSVEAHQSP